MSTRKQDRNQESPSNTGPMVVLIGGGLAVAALVGWAVMRSMQAPMTTPVAPEPAPIAQTTTTAAPATTTFTPPPNPPPQPQDDETAAVARTEVAQLKQQIASGAVTVIDVRDMDSYVREHIPGALHVPLTRIQGEIGLIPKDKPIVTYCT